MNIAVLSDIHSNNVALKACIQYLDNYPKRWGESIDHIIFLGDYVTDGPYPEKTMDIIYDLIKRYPSTCIRGNREEYLLEYENKAHNWKRCSGSGLLLYTYEHLRQEDWIFFKSLDNHKILKLNGIEPITIMHGSQFKSRDNYYENPDVGDYSMQEAATKLLLGGHSHVQHTVEKYGKTYINPGSVGESYGGTGGCAQFTVISYAFPERDSMQKRMDVKNFTIPYSIDEYMQQIKESGLLNYSPYLTRLMELFCKTGINYFFKGVNRVCELSGCTPADADEKIWKIVYEEMKKDAESL